MSTNITTLFTSFRRNILLAAFAPLLLLPFTTVQAQTDDDNRWSVSLGVFITDRSTDTRLDGTGGDPGTPVDVERDLGLDNSDSVFRLDGYFKFNEKHRIDASWFDLSRTGTKVIQKDIEWNDTIFPIDTQINSDFDLAIYKLSYTWSFMRRDNSFLGLTGGLYIADIGAALDGPILGAREAADVTAPLPVVGLRGQYDFAEKWSLRYSGEFFALEVDNWDGSIVDLYAGVDYQFHDKFAVGLGYNSVTIDVDVAKNDFTGSIDWGYGGALLFLKFDF